ncbi:hypothetical protein [Taklimakanibacter lacteus]|uniref:hypothetical protein n=1 Tax=Taklimakanibacter lacteus TaxID=2268456 RepID=UPI000E67162F
MKILFAMLLLAGSFLATPAAANVSCDGAATLVCTDSALRALNEDLGAREALLKAAAMHPAFRSELAEANEDWEAAIEDCAASANAAACYGKRLTQRIAVFDLLKRLFAGPHLPQSAVEACSARGAASNACYDGLFAAADTVYAITARAFQTSLAAVNIQTPTAPDGGTQASTAEEAFRAWRTAECAALSQSPMIEQGEAGGVIACQIDLTWRELSGLAALLGRQPHWSERIPDYAPRIRACLDRGRDDDVDLRVVDIFMSEDGEVIRLMGSRGRYDCSALAGTISSFAATQGRSVRPGEGEAAFIPVQGLRPPEQVLAAKAGCYETQAVIVAEARLSGWVAVSHCE